MVLEVNHAFKKIMTKAYFQFASIFQLFTWEYSKFLWP